MTRLFQLAAAAIFTATLAPAQIAPMTPSAPPEPPRPQKHQKAQPENVEWIWQYTPDAQHPDGRENDLVQDSHFRPFLDQFFTAPQTFWGPPGHYPPLSDVVLEHLTVPGKVLGDQNRYVSISGAVVHFGPARGLLWIDLNGKQHLVAFAAINWTNQGHPTSDPAAEYTLWLFPNQPLSIDGPTQHPSPALTHAIGAWVAQPLAGSEIIQKITHAIVVDPDGTPHEVPPAALGVVPPAKSDTDNDAPALKPRN